VDDDSDYEPTEAELKASAKRGGEWYPPARKKTLMLSGEINDLYFRMLKPHEVQAGMAFDHDYQVLGNSREKVKQLGNAVTPPVMEMLIERCVQSLM
jgi:site-specific DNA-cytosine methylase